MVSIYLLKAYKIQILNTEALLVTSGEIGPQLMLRELSSCYFHVNRMRKNVA